MLHLSRVSTKFHHKIRGYFNDISRIISWFLRMLITLGKFVWNLMTFQGFHGSAWNSDLKDFSRMWQPCFSPHPWVISENPVIGPRSVPEGLCWLRQRNVATILFVNALSLLTLIIPAYQELGIGINRFWKCFRFIENLGILHDVRKLPPTSLLHGLVYSTTTPTCQASFPGNFHIYLNDAQWCYKQVEGGRLWKSCRILRFLIIFTHFQCVFIVEWTYR